MELDDTALPKSRARLASLLWRSSGRRSVRLGGIRSCSGTKSARHSQ